MRTVSVIIPTHNRMASLKRTLDALKIQTYPPQKMEVLVVADGCSDGTVEMLRNYEAPFLLQVIEQPGGGAAIARNQGASQSTGSLLLFIDDDIEAERHLVEAHVNAHQQQPNRVVIGYLPPFLQSQTGLFRNEIRAFWEDAFQVMRQPGHRYTYQNLLSGNFSLPTELFNCLGGFDCTFGCREDYEFGLRLIKVGANFTFAPDALGYHHEMTDLNRSLRRKFQEGKADVQLGRKHPELRYLLPLSDLEVSKLLVIRLLIAFAFALPTLGDWLAACLQQTLNLLEGLRLRLYWRQLLGVLLAYWYWRGVAEALGTQRSLVSFLQGGTLRTDEAGSELEVDLREGLAGAEQLLDEKRPASVCIRYGSQPVGRIPPTPGCELLRGAHLRPLLATTLAFPLLQALALENATSAIADFERLPIPYSSDRPSVSISQ